MCQKCDQIKFALGDEAYELFAQARLIYAPLLNGVLDRVVDQLADQQFREALGPALALVFYAADLALMAEDPSYTMKSIDRYSRTFDLIRDELVKIQATYVTGVATAREKGELLP